MHCNTLHCITLQCVVTVYYIETVHIAAFQCTSILHSVIAVEAAECNMTLCIAPNVAQNAVPE